MGRPVIVWDGEHLPQELGRVPPGRYALEAAADDIPLTEAEDRGIAQAFDQLDAGQGRSVAEVLAELRGRNRGR